MDGETGLYPEDEIMDIEVPDDEDPDEEEIDDEYKKSVYFDIEKGDFALDGAGRLVESTGYESYIQWCMKAVSTPRYNCLAYDDEIGTEIEDSMLLDTREAVESAVEREISETLLINPRTEQVQEFTFEWQDGGILSCTFVVKGKGYDPFRIEDFVLGAGG